jgi:hypothetical protein
VLVIADRLLDEPLDTGELRERFRLTGREVDVGPPRRAAKQRRVTTRRQLR